MTQARSSKQTKEPEQKEKVYRKLLKTAGEKKLNSRESSGAEPAAKFRPDSSKYVN
jgi:hypothetical protein